MLSVPSSRILIIPIDQPIHLFVYITLAKGTPMISRQCFRRLNGFARHGKACPCAPAMRPCRYYSSTASHDDFDFDTVGREMLSRPHKHIWDVMSPTNSHLLNVALADFLPSSCQPAHFVKAGVVHPAGRSYDQADLRNAQGKAATAQNKAAELNLPEGHHLVYFPPQIRASDLLPDGTDPYQSPGAPFVRRMWAGGSIDFGSNLSLDSSPALCVESISKVNLRGPPGEDKMFVEVLRRYMDEIQFKRELQVPGMPDLVDGPWKGPVEKRTLVFLRRRDAEKIDPSKLEASSGQNRVVKGRRMVIMTAGKLVSDCVKLFSHHIMEVLSKSRLTCGLATKTADFSITLVPTRMLLFQFSALTHNAHSIHLNQEYCREVEGHRNLLVHGPLSLTLMLSVLRSQLDQDTVIRCIDYRNLAPLYVDEPMNVCVRKKDVGKKDDHDESSSDAQEWDVWVENKDGSLSIKGTAMTSPRRHDEGVNSLET